MGQQFACATAAGGTGPTQQLGIVLKREPQAAALIAGLSQRIIRARGYAQKLLQPVLFASPVDALHLRLYTAGSLPGDVLAACGMRNAWRASGGAEGNVLVELTRIATLDARPILLVAADQREAVAHWQQSRLWRSLPLTSRYPLALIEQPISNAGALITAGRFADIFSQLMAGWRDA